jgi:hypothetical protein
MPMLRRDTIKKPEPLAAAVFQLSLSIVPFDNGGQPATKYHQPAGKGYVLAAEFRCNLTMISESPDTSKGCVSFNP